MLLLSPSLADRFRNSSWDISEGGHFFLEHDLARLFLGRILEQLLQATMGGNRAARDC